eukprot:13837862-Alexandrium_andersonii.AAC.1
MLHAQLSIDGARPVSALTTRDFGQLEREAPGRVVAPGSWLFAMSTSALGSKLSYPGICFRTATQ